MDIAAKASIEPLSPHEPLVTVLLVLVIVGILALIAAGPIRAVREDRGYALEEQAWLAGGHLPPRWCANTATPTDPHDGARLRELGYEVGERRTVRGAWGRLQAVTWRAAGPPAGAPDPGTPWRIRTADLRLERAVPARAAGRARTLLHQRARPLASAAEPRTLTPGSTPPVAIPAAA